MFDRLELLTNIQKFKNAHVLLIGLGGVGGYTFECLVRSGVGKLTVIDKDVFEISNLNRQVLANLNTLGQAKVTVAMKRAKEINPETKIIPLKINLSKENLKEICQNNYDFIIDACDDLTVKTELIKLSYDNHLNLITCLGTANRFHAEQFKITTLDKTSNDPLAKKMRHLLPDKYKKTPVLWSQELPLKIKGLGTICPVPMAAGSILASYVLNKILNN